MNEPALPDNQTQPATLPPEQEATAWQSWQAACHKLGIPLSDAQLAQFQTLYRDLIAYNRQVNLTRITDLPDFLNRHLLDSLAISRFIPPNTRLADIGSGGGFPALPLAIARPDLSITAVESVGKKCAFISQMRDTLSLQNLTVLTARSEDLSRNPQYREQFDVVTARAVAALPVLLELTLPLAKPGGQLLAMKGLRYEEELTTAQNALKQLHARLLSVERFTEAQPNEALLSGAIVLVFEKTRPTPPNYPRAAGLPNKKPL